MRQIRTALLGEKENWAKALGISTKIFQKILISLKTYIIWKK